MTRVATRVSRASITRFTTLPRPCQIILSGASWAQQPVEKVGIEQIVTTNRAPRAPKPVCLVSDLGCRRKSESGLIHRRHTLTLGSYVFPGESYQLPRTP
jgi:hypothetical protein